MNKTHLFIFSSAKDTSIKSLFNLYYPGPHRKLCLEFRPSKNHQSSIKIITALLENCILMVKSILLHTNGNVKKVFDLEGK